VQSRLTAADPTYHVRGGASYDYDISVTSLQNPYLPLPYPITDLADRSGLGSAWHLDPDTGVAFSQGAPATGLKYRVIALQPNLRAADLRDATVPPGQFWPQLALPSGLSPEVATLAQQAVAGSDTNYDKALALQRWFTTDGGFRYSTSVRSGADADYLAEFLRERIGYCEQYAAAMAVMARTLGIPSRVAVGFTQGSRLDDDTWQVTVHDAHAWPELWFGGIGWVRFEPTPRSDATVVPPDYAPVPAGGANPGQAGADSRALSRLEGFNKEAAPPATRGVPGPLVLLMAVLACAGLALLGWPMLRRAVRRRRRLHARSYVDMVNGAWAEVADTAVDLGQPWSVTSTPRQAAERLARGMTPPAAAALGRIRAQVEQVRYAQERPHDERAAAVRADVRRVRSELIGRVRWQTRLIGYCSPPSERRRQRSSMRSMNPADLAARGSGEPVGAAPSAGRAWKDE
jgi:transglutaminase-like putative cysteine protease